MATETLTQTIAKLTLRSQPPPKEEAKEEVKNEHKEQAPYKYQDLTPVFPKDEHYPPLVPFEHTDPGHRALLHPNPRSFLERAASIDDLTPNLGTEVRGVNLATLTTHERDQLALEVARRGLVVFRDQEEFIDRGAEFYREWGRHFGRLHIHPTSGHPDGVPEIHLVYRDANSTYNFEYDDSITSTAWHSDVSYELQPPGLTTFFLLSQPRTGGDTLFTSQADFSRSGRRGGVVRREPVEHIHPVVRRHPVTGEEALYVNRQFTRRIVGLKKEESEAILNFIYAHMAGSVDLQARVHWTPNTVVLWDNRITAHSAIADYGKGLDTERRHGARITPQAERPIAAWDGLEL